MAKNKDKKIKAQSEEVLKDNTPEEKAAEDRTKEAKEEAAAESEAASSGENGEDAGADAPEKEDPKDAKLKELEDKVVRQMAEFDNFRKRTEKEKGEMFANGEKVVIESILPVIDNFERALDMSGSEEKEKDPFMEGMEMVYRQLMDELKKLGVEPIEALGADFDPNLHNAVMQEASEEYESGKVCKELQKGYTLNGSVVRHAMVSVTQ